MTIYFIAHIIISALYLFVFKFAITELFDDEDVFTAEGDDMELAEYLIFLLIDVLGTFAVALILSVFYEKELNPKFEQDSTLFFTSIFSMFAFSLLFMFGVRSWRVVLIYIMVYISAMICYYSLYPI